MGTSVTYDILGKEYTFNNVQKIRGGWIRGYNERDKRGAYLWPEYIQEDGLRPVAAKLVKGNLDDILCGIQ